MPRQGVPYPGREICSLKCQIDALNAKINELMKSINGVQGDGQGDLTLVSGDPAIVINNDAVQNQIEIALDGSQLPAAAVSSVNSQTGAVVLEADDIPSDGNSDVQADIDALKAADTNLQGAISNEATARGNADAALQGNINAVSASLPAAAAAAVAADPTVAQLAADVPNKLDKISSGSTLKAYTHVGANQGEKSVVDGTTADSLAIRDADGRLQAADPAAGATDKTLVTANWVSQTGEGRPNNLIHDSGTESVDGYKIFSGTIATANVGQAISRTLGYHKVFNLGSKPSSSQSWYFNFLFNYRYSSTLFYCEAYYDQNSDSFGVTVSGVKTTGIFIDSNYTGNTTISLDIINDEVWVVIHRVSQNNAFSRLTMLSIQRSTNLNTPQKFEAEDTVYTPAGTLSERYIS